jgi:cytidyltransferase-like protein
MIVLCDGVFDPLHAGHLAYLNYARTLGEVVVQVSSQRKRPECVPWVTRTNTIVALGFRAVAYEKTLYALDALRPSVYFKGADWADKGIPADEAAFCAANGIEVRYAPADLPTDSSTALLTSWATRTADAGVDALDAAAQAQVVVPWDAAANGYTLEQRRAVEGRHPDILADLCRGLTVLDYGCGPGYSTTLLRDADVKAWGYDPHLPNPLPDDVPKRIMRYLSRWYFAHDQYSEDDRTFDVVVCREVLEHVPVREWGNVVHDLFRLASRWVYITTRFNPAPAHPYDLTDETTVDPSHITCLPQSFLRALCVTMGGTRDREKEQLLDWQGKGRVLVYRVTR